MPDGIQHLQPRRNRRPFPGLARGDPDAGQRGAEIPAANGDIRHRPAPGADLPEAESLRGVRFGIDHVPAVRGKRRSEREPAGRHQFHRVRFFRIQQHQAVAVAPIARGPVQRQDGLSARGAGPGLRRDGFRPERGLGAVRAPHDHRVRRGPPLGQIGEGSIGERLRPHLQTAALRDARGFAGFDRQAPNVEITLGGGTEVEGLSVGRPRRVENDGFIFEEQRFLTGRDLKRPDREPLGVVAQEREPAAIRMPRGPAVGFTAAGHPASHPGLRVQQPDPTASGNRDGPSIR